MGVALIEQIRLRSPGGARGRPAAPDRQRATTRPHRAPRPGRASQVVSFDRLIDGLWATTCPPMPLSLTAAALSALQTFLRYPELAQKHHSASHAYGALRRKLEHAMTFTPALCCGFVICPCVHAQTTMADEHAVAAG